MIPTVNARGRAFAVSHPRSVSGAGGTGDGSAVVFGVPVTGSDVSNGGPPGGPSGRRRGGRRAWAGDRKRGRRGRPGRPGGCPGTESVGRGTPPRQPRWRRSARPR